MKVAKVTWSETHTYEAYVEIPDDFDVDDYDMDALADINYDTNCTGCTDRTVDDIEEVKHQLHPPFDEVHEVDWELHRYNDPQGEPE